MDIWRYIDTYIYLYNTYIYYILFQLFQIFQIHFMYFLSLQQDLSHSLLGFWFQLDLSKGWEHEQMMYKVIWCYIILIENIISWRKFHAYIIFFELVSHLRVIFLNWSKHYFWIKAILFREYQRKSRYVNTSLTRVTKDLNDSNTNQHKSKTGRGHEK